MEAETGAKQLQAKECQQELKEAKKKKIKKRKEKRNKTLDLWNYERINFCCFKPSNLVFNNL